MAKVKESRKNKIVTLKDMVIEDIKKSNLETETINEALEKLEKIQCIDVDINNVNEQLGTKLSHLFSFHNTPDAEFWRDINTQLYE